MPHQNMAAAALIAILAVAPVASAATIVGPQVKRIVGATVNLYDSAGKYIGLEDAKPISGLLPLPIEKEDRAKGRVGVVYQGKLVFLRNAEVETQGIASTCAKVIVASRPADSRIAASDFGARAGLGTDGVHCLLSDDKK